jgi:phage terminase large subunit-like protein
MVILPDNAKKRYRVNDFIEECVAFPNGAHDDQVDAMTQALVWWHMAPTQTVIYYNEPVQISAI